MALGRKSVEYYKILINRDELICPHQVLFIFYHELGHIVRCHLGYRYYTGGHSAQEREADEWAFLEMGITDKRGQVREQCRVCHACICQRSKKCLKGLVL